MTIVANRPTLLGDLLKAELGAEHSYSREMKSLTVAEYSETAPHGVEIGQVYKEDGTILEASDVAGLSGDAVRILIDDAVYTDGHADASTGSYAVLGAAPAGGGMVVVAREQLKFGDALSSAQVDAVVVELAKQGIKVAAQV